MRQLGSKAGVAIPLWTLVVGVVWITLALCPTVSAWETRMVTYGQAASPAGSAPKPVAGGRNKLFFDFKNVPLSEVAEFIATRAGLNGVALEPGLESVPVTCEQYGVSAELALRRVARAAACGVERIDVNTYRIVRQKPVSLTYVDGDIRSVIKQITKLADASVILHNEVQGQVNLQLTDVPWRDALDTVVRTAGDFVVVEESGGILRVLPLTALFNQRKTRVFQLHYIQPPDTYEALIDTKYAERTAKAGRRRLTFSAHGSDFRSKAGEGLTKEAKAQTDILKRLKKIGGTTFTLFNALLSVMSPVGRFEYDTYSNSIIATDIPSKLDVIQDVISLLDIEPAQVFMDAKFITTSNDDLMDFGVNYVAASPDQGITISHSGGSFATILPFTRGSGGLEELFAVVEDGPPAVSYVNGVAVPAASANFSNAQWAFGLLDFSQFTTLLSIIKRDSASNIVQAPKIMTLDNHDATIFVGRTVSYAETVSESTESGGVELNIREADDSPVETGFQLFVTPHVVRGTDNVILTVIPQDQTLAGNTSPIPGFNRFGQAPNVIELPQIDSRTLVTKVMLRSGQTLALGGLVDERETETIRKVPFLGDMPFIGYLFKFRNRTKNRSNLLIFLTVVVMRDAEDTQRIYTVHREYESGFISATERIYLSEEEMPESGASTLVLWS